MPRFGVNVKECVGKGYASLGQIWPALFEQVRADVYMRLVPLLVPDTESFANYKVMSGSTGSTTVALRFNERTKCAESAPNRHANSNICKRKL